MCKAEILPFCLLGTKVVHMGNAVTRLPIIIKDKLAGKTYRLEHILAKLFQFRRVDRTNYHGNHAKQSSSRLQNQTVSAPRQ